MTKMKFASFNGEWMTKLFGQSVWSFCLRGGGEGSSGFKLLGRLFLAWSGLWNK